ncbi:PREDICTED: uncharacterized protein LOC108366871 [Rhagoletis zephyria]|uniref:uncharacterized protein LOC108366871 n=1 Tax=Rhagoletis zephyria TaxID=28612 RepID=UPI000811A260|nr:PREDICTED: uncharacterized protein LOC108366871 [Rhagoletis zephyria]
MAVCTDLLAFWSLLVCLEFVLATNLYAGRKLRLPRTLIYPETAPTRLQFIGGIGIPVEDLTYESVTSGYVLKAEYFMPTKAAEMRPQYLTPQNVNRRSLADNVEYNYTIAHAYNVSENQPSILGPHHERSDINLQGKQKTASAYRWVIYKGMETLMNRAGLSGRECMLRSICEHAAVPFHYESGILSEILHIILTPSRSRDELVHPNDRDYGRAERLGRGGEDCALTYAACEYSPIEQISTVLDLDVEFNI